MNTTIEHFFASAARGGDKVAFRHRAEGAWRDTSWREVERTVRRVGRALIALGVPARGNVVVLAPNRPEWLYAAYGAQAAGAAPVGIYTTSTAEQTAYIVAHAEALVAVVNDAGQLAKLQSQRARLPDLKTIVLLTGAGDGDGVLGWEQFLARGDATPEAEVEARVKGLGPGDVASLIYTSGTTGTPKGVMLTHANLVESLGAVIRHFHLNPEGEVVLSYLPLSHIAEQLVSLWSTALTGNTVGFCEELDQVGDALREVRPTLFFAVPRVWEKIQAKMVEAAGQNPWLTKKIAAWARGVGLRSNLAKAEGRPVPGGYGLAHKLVFSKVRARLGLDRCHTMTSGAAALSKTTLEFFLSLDMPIYEVYGMSECTGVLTTCRPEAFRPGTVGRVVEGFTCKLAEDGEILMKGPLVFKGYLKSPEATAEALDADGWLHSGDIGALDADGYLKITDRKKELFKTAGGKYIAPQYLEGLLKGIPGIGQAAVVGGDDRKYVAALLTLDPVTGPKLAASLGASGTPEQLAAHPKVLAHVQAELDKVNEKLARYESIKRFTLLGADFSVDGGELTPTMKLRRKEIARKYAQQIDALFAEAPPAAASSAA